MLFSINGVGSCTSAYKAKKRDNAMAPCFYGALLAALRHARASSSLASAQLPENVW